jgi:large subunit ribosomal protein L6
MSRIGKLPIKVPVGVEVTQNGLNLIVKGKFGQLEQGIPESIIIGHQNETLVISPKVKTRTSQSLHGLYRSLINNMVVGVSEKFKITLLLQGVGYRAVVKGKQIVLNLGYSHQVELKIPETVSIEVVKNTTLILEGCDKQELGLFASKIRSWRPPEPYKGKGIRYENENVKRKAGKSGKK